MWANNLRIIAVVLGTLALYTLIANKIPQVQSEVPHALTLGANVTPEHPTGAPPDWPYPARGRSCPRWGAFSRRNRSGGWLHFSRRTGGRATLRGRISPPHQALPPLPPLAPIPGRQGRQRRQGLRMGAR